MLQYYCFRQLTLLIQWPYQYYNITMFLKYALGLNINGRNYCMFNQSNLYQLRLKNEGLLSFSKSWTEYTKGLV